MSPREREDHDTLSTSDSGSERGEQEHQQLDQAKRVTFGSIRVREFNRIVGDHPDVRVGPPLALGWEFVEGPPSSLENYEESHQGNRLKRLTSITRKNLLHHVHGIPEEEIRSAEKEVQRIRKQRNATTKVVQRRAKIFGALESVKSKLKQTFSIEKMGESLSMSSSAHILPVGLPVQ